MDINKRNKRRLQNLFEYYYFYCVDQIVIYLLRIIEIQILHSKKRRMRILGTVFFFKFFGGKMKIFNMDVLTVFFRRKIKLARLYFF